MAPFSSQGDSSAKLAKVDTVKQPLEFDNLFGLPLGRRAVFIEVFAGCARLSRFAQRAGFVVLPVDRPRNVHKPEASLLTLDLCEADPQNCLLSIIHQIRPAAIHVVLPCGTGSRARQKPIPSSLRQQGAPAPRQLRDAMNPGANPIRANQS